MYSFVLYLIMLPVTQPTYCQMIGKLLNYELEHDD
jgi:hypothetical protein